MQKKQEKQEINLKKQEKAITLIALVVTIVVLLILAGITIMLLMGNNGVIKRAQEAQLEQKIADARERLQISLADAGIKKQVDQKYDQNNYLDAKIMKDIPGSEMIGDIAVVDGLGFLIDRSVPKIAEYAGKRETLVFPEVTTSVKLADDLTTATITIKAKEETNGISKIEILQDGFVIDKFDYSNEKEEIKKEYDVSRNGTYIIRVYSELYVSKIQEVKGLVATVEYTPNGKEEWKKGHSVKVVAKETGDKIKSIKYQWTQTTEDPDEGTFTEEKKVTNGGTIAKNDGTGKYYLWTLLETESGKKRIERSEVFYFDNTGPTVKLTATPVSESSFTLKAEATDAHVGTIRKYEFYTDGTTPVDTQETTEASANYTITDAAMGEKDCYVIVTDKAGNTTKQTVTARTKMYAWEKWSIKETTTWTQSGETYINKSWDGSYNSPWRSTSGNFGYSLASNGCWKINGTKNVRPGYIACHINYSYGRAYSQEDSPYQVVVCLDNAVDNYSYFYMECLWIPWNKCSYTPSITFKQLNKVKNVTVSKGATNYGLVTSTMNDTYPTNGKSGSYWYISKGLI